MGTETPALEVPPQVLSYLDGQLTLTLATATRDGVPRATTLTYTNVGASLYVWTRPETTTARQMEENPVVSLAIDEYTDDWRDTKGIQATGEARVVLNPTELDARSWGCSRRSTRRSSASSAAASRSSGSRRASCSSSTTRTPASRPVAACSTSATSSTASSTTCREERVASMAASLQTVQVPAGEVIVRQGAPADKFFIIVEGEVEVVRDDDGTSRKLATLAGGQFFGEMAILRDLPRMATVRAVTATTLFAMERDAFRGLVAQSMGTTTDFDQVIQQRLGEIQAG